VRVAAAQAASVRLDSAATTDKVVALIERASGEGVEMLVSPETFLSGYPFWVMLGGGGRFGDAEQARAYGAYLEAAVELDGPELRRATEAARDLRVFETHDIDERRSSLMPVLIFGESRKPPSGVVPDPPRLEGVGEHVASY